MASLRFVVPFVALALVPTLAHAQEPETDDFIPMYEEQLLGFEDLALDTGWIPNGSPVQMRFYASAANTIAAVLPGEAHYDWPSETLRFVGDPDSGFFSYDVGLELYAGVKVDAAIIQWESDLLGPYDYQVDELAWFTPYLLEGNPQRPATIMSQTDGFTLASVPIVPDIVILSGNLDIDLAIDITASLACNRIEVQGPLGAAEFTIEDEEQVVAAGEGLEDLELEATLFCQLVTMPTLIVRPHLVMTVAFDEYDIAGIDIPIDLPTVDEEIAFESIMLSFPRPEPPSETGEETGGDTGGESGGDTGGNDEVGDESGAGLSGGEALDDGCACTSERSSGGPLGLVLLGGVLLGLRGRQRRVSE